MGNLIDAIGRNFERLLRWFYPGLLLLVLLQIGRPKLLYDRILPDEDPVLALVAITLVGSFLLYAIQRYVIHEVIYYCLYNWFNPPRRCSDTAEITFPGPKRYGRAPWRYWDANADFAKVRFSSSSGDGFSGWLMYQFAMAHALGITGWLLAAMSLLSEDDSVLRDLSPWPLALAPLILFAWGWQLAHNFAGNRLLGPPPSDDEWAK